MKKYKMSCLFNSLQNLFKPEGNMRDVLCDFMKNNINEQFIGECLMDWIKMVNISETGKEDYISYIEKMRKRSTWGGGMEIAIASYVFDATIDVIKANTNKKVATFNCGKGLRKASLLWTGGHYTPIGNVE